MNEATKKLQKLVKARKTPVVKSEQKKFNPYKKSANSSYLDDSFYNSSSNN